MSAQTSVGTVCKDIPGSFNDTSKWVYSRGAGKCREIHPKSLERRYSHLANEIVFVFQVKSNRSHVNAKKKMSKFVVVVKFSSDASATRRKSAAVFAMATKI